MSKTAMAEMEISREKAQAVFELNARLNGKGRRIPKLPESVSKLSTETQVYIFNVGPWQHTQLMGSLGTYHIPACPDGKEYSDPVVIPGIITELYPAGDKYDLLIEENSTGWETAQQIIGVGKHMLPGNSLIKVGVSVSHVWPPSEEDIAKAKRALYNRS